MFEVIRAFWAPKTYGYDQEYEDAANWNPPLGIAAIADGVSSAIFSRAWADILTTAVVTNPPVDPTVDGGLSAWLEPHRQAWSQRIDLPKLKWNQIAKLNQIGGGWVTLLWLQLELGLDRADSSTGKGEEDTSAEEREDLNHSDFANGEYSVVNEEGGTAIWPMTCHAIGDCNVFVVRGGTMRLSHPMQSSSAYAQKPQAVCSMNRDQDGQLNILTTTFDCEAGDMLVLCTDAVGQWLWSELEQHSGDVDWQRLENLSDEEWRAEVERLRGEERMPIDDCTLVILRVGGTPPAPLPLNDFLTATDAGTDIITETENQPTPLTIEDVVTVENASDLVMEDMPVNITSDCRHDGAVMAPVTAEVTASITAVPKADVDVQKPDA